MKICRQLKYLKPWWFRYRPVWCCSYLSRLMTEPRKWHVRPPMTQISLGIRPVWSVFAVRLKKHWALSYPLSVPRRLWSYWSDAQADLSLRWADMSVCWFWRVAAHFVCLCGFYYEVFHVVLPCSLFLTHICLVVRSILINWTSPVPILAVSGVLFHFLLYFE